VIFLEVLVEGSSDVPAVRHILERRFGLKENESFRIHPHRGKGKLPGNPLAPPDPTHRGLLDQLPAKLQGYSALGEGYGVVVLVDADDDDCKVLKEKLIDLYEVLPKKPRNVLFRIAVEETESWFLADPDAIRKAYPRAKIKQLSKVAPDAVVGAWERLAECLGHVPSKSGGMKLKWAEDIAPHLDLDNPASPSLKAFVAGVLKFQAKLQD
jgi:hypothetical protein